MQWTSVVIVALFGVAPAFAKTSLLPRTCAEALEAHLRDPADLYGPLFHAVQTSGLYADSKYFPDMNPRFSPAEILSAYQAAAPQDPLALRQFIDAHFYPLAPPPTEVLGALANDSSGHIRKLWPLLTRQPHANLHLGTSLIPLDEAYVVPGGRFDEIYYWDSYFTQLGLLEDNQDAAFQSMVRVFSKMILKIGHVPNGNRSYYLSRSQPPVFALMVTLWQERFGAESAAQFLPALKAEHAYWMEGAETLARGEAHRHVVRLNDGALLNRFWDDKDTPRSEAYKEDLELNQHAAEKHGRNPAEVFRDIRAAAESGWDFSSRWFGDSKDFTTIETTSIAPVDLNSLLFFAEEKIAELDRAQGDIRSALIFQTRAAERRAAIQRHMWDGSVFQDLSWKSMTHTGRVSIATAVPLFAGLATKKQAAKVASRIETDFLRPGGVATTLVRSGQQWDEPNGWAPCQWFAYAGIMRYGHSRLGEDVRRRWVDANERVFRRTGKMMEKYNVETPELEAGGGEYPGQDGFGWSNGIRKAFASPGAALRHLGVKHP